MGIGENYFVKQRQQVKKKMLDLVMENEKEEDIIITMGKLYGYKHTTLKTMLDEVKRENEINE